jgi:hypothetical protein
MVLANKIIPKAWKAANQFYKINKKYNLSETFLLKRAKKVVLIESPVGPLKSVKTRSGHSRPRPIHVSKKRKTKISLDCPFNIFERKFSVV